MYSNHSIVSFSPWSKLYFGCHFVNFLIFELSHTSRFTSLFSGLILFSSVLRLWNGDYVRIRGYQRELSHWIKKNSITNKNQNFLTSKNIENSFIVPNFIKKAEAVVTRKNKIKNITINVMNRELSSPSALNCAIVNFDL